MPDWRELPPESLILDPTLTSDIPAHQMAGEAIRYSRMAGASSYDELGFRVHAAAPLRGPVPLQTIPGMRLARRNEDLERTSPEVAELTRQEELLQHRPIEVPSDGQLSYTVDRQLIHFHRPRADARFASDQEVWTFSLKAPPASLLSLCTPRDEPRIAAHSLRVDLPGVFWIPLPLLIENGRLLRMQAWRERLATQAAAPNFYCFISHRWLTPTHPDPEAAQAALIAWQIFGHLCEAVRVAKRRGLTEPRKALQGFGFTLGIQGSSLAEALVVNVLRQGLDAERLDAAFEEVASLESLDDYGIAAAHGDPGLRRLRELLGGLPVLSALVGRILVWYDYGSMPQPPRTEEEEATFREGLKYLNAVQIMGRTAILLDEAEDYLSRGWCTLEAVVADSVAGVKDLLVGSRRDAGGQGSVESYFDTLLEDRPHLLWRAVLDTEVFRVQTKDKCLSRLDLAVTDPRDIPFIYQGLVRLGAPRKVHIDDSEIVTGVLPLPVVSGAVLIPKSTGRPIIPKHTAEARRDLDWSNMLSLPQDGNPAGEAPAWSTCAAPQAGRPSCHVAIVASCEGEAVLLARRILSRRGELESLLSTSVVSLSWLASDIAPVGHMVDGRLRALAVEAEVWVVVAAEARLSHCTTTGALLAAIRASGLAGFEIVVDQPKGNVREARPRPQGEAAVILARETEESVQAVPLPQARLPSIAGGVFRSGLLGALLRQGQ